MREHTETVNLGSEWDAGLKNIDTKLTYDPEIIAAPERRLIKFNEEAQKLRTTLVGKASTPNVDAGLQNYMDRTYPMALVDAKAKGLKEGVLIEQGKLTTSLYQLSEDAARVGIDNPFLRDVKLAQGRDLIETGKKTGVISAPAAAKMDQDFTVHTETNYMTVVGRQNPEAMMRMYDAGAFEHVPIVHAEALYDRALKVQTANASRQRQMDADARKIHADNLEREAERRITMKNITQEFIEQNREWVSPATAKAWDKAWKDQQGRIGTGDPQFEARLRQDVFDPSIDPKVTYETLKKAYAGGYVGSEYYTPWAEHLGSIIRQQFVDARADRKEGEARVRDIKAARFHEAKDNIKNAFGTTSPYEKYDAVAHEAMAQMNEELQRRSEYLGQGTEDSLMVFQSSLPKAIARVQDRATTRLNYIKQELHYSTEAAIEADRKKLGEAEYYKQSEMIREYRYIMRETQRLQTLGDTNKPAAAQEQRK